MSECDYGGCIHKLICTKGCTGAKCDSGLSAVYSSTGMVCNASCTYEEFNLSTSQQECKSQSCPNYKVVVSQTQTACIVLFSELSSNPLTSQKLWTEGPS